MFIPSSLIRKKKLISKNKEKIHNDKKSNLIRQVDSLQNDNLTKETIFISSSSSNAANFKNNVLLEKEQKQNVEDNTENILTLQSEENLEKNVENEMIEKSPNVIEEELIEEEEEAEGVEDKVKEFSFQQRWPLDDEEPICVICGRYGEYICDETDHDVCSMECKKLDIESTNINANAIANDGDGKSSISTTNKKPTDIPLMLHKISFPIQKILINDIIVSSVSLEDFKKKHNSVEIKGAGDIVNEDIPNPISNFESLGLNNQLFRNLKKYRYSKPTLIQMVTIPSLISGHDMLVKSPMKSGKTMAYLLPLILHCINMAQCFIGLDGISSNYNTKMNTNLELENFKNYKMMNKNFGPYAIILTPSKELCIQIESLCKKLLVGIPYMKTALLIGGAPYPNQLYRLRSGVQIIIATPSRLLEILKKSENESDMEVLDEEITEGMSKKGRKKGKFDQQDKSNKSSINYLSWDLVSYLVLDEIDQMINYGEEETLRNILEKLKTVNRAFHFKKTTIVAPNENKYIGLNKKPHSGKEYFIHSFQVSLFSSTIPTKIIPICKKFLNSSYITVMIKDDAEIASELSASLNVTARSSSDHSNSNSNSVSSNFTLKSTTLSSTSGQSISMEINPSIHRTPPVTSNILAQPIVVPSTLSSSTSNYPSLSNYPPNRPPPPLPPPPLPLPLSTSSTMKMPNSIPPPYTYFRPLPPLTTPPPPSLPSSLITNNMNGQPPPVHIPNVNYRPRPSIVSPPSLPLTPSIPLSNRYPRPSSTSSRPIETQHQFSSGFSTSNSTTSKPMVKQTFLWVEDNSKKKELFKLLMDSRYFHPLIIIFVDSRLGAELLTKAIQKKTGLGVACVHGQKSIEERKKILEEFKLGGAYPIMVSTSGILGRGVHLEDVRMVIQFDCASTVEDYIHQIGRCALLTDSSANHQMTRKAASLYFPKGNKHFRTGHPWLGGSGGWAITFINKSNESLFPKLYHQYLEHLSSSELTPLPTQFLKLVKK